MTKLNFSISSGIQLEAIEIKAYQKPIVEIDKTTSDQTITAEDIKTLGTRNINAIASTVSGISSVDGEISLSEEHVRMVLFISWTVSESQEGHLQQLI